MSEMLNIEELFGSNVFTLGTMKERLPKEVYKEVKKVMNQGGELSKEDAKDMSAAECEEIDTTFSVMPLSAEADELVRMADRITKEAHAVLDK